MGRNEHASFSSRGKSNLQLLERKTRKKGYKVKGRKGKESEKREEVCRNAEKARKRFWWRWLSFMRGHWSGPGPLRTEDSPGSVSTALQSFDSATESSPTSMDFIEIPIEPGQKISKILIKPTRTGIKAMIAQCRTPLCAADTPPPDDASWEGTTLAHSDTRLSQESPRPRRRSANWTTTLFNNQDKISGSKETLLTSALFIREDMDNIVESAVFIEPSLPNDYTDSKKSDDFSQKSIKINKRRVSYRIVDERNDSVRRTIKTVSEPTWMEREKILHRQRLHENINNLLEQFMFLESEDVVGLTIPHSRAGHDRKMVHFDGDSSLPVGGHLIKEISREVSPEILVNIKPFKEYLSDDYLSLGGSTPRGDKIPALPSRGCSRRGSSTHLRAHELQLSRTTTPSLARSLKKSDAGHETNESPKDCAHPVSIAEDCAEVAEKESGFGGGVGREELSPIASVGCVKKEESPMCSIWGVCKTYSGAPQKGAAGPAESPAGEQGKKSLDELLDTLDDSDHDVVFQKNIAQFRKKINVVPRLDLRKSNAKTSDAKRTDHKKMKRPQTHVDLVKPIIECVVEESEEEEREGAAPQRKTEAVVVCSPEKWGDQGKWREVFVSHLVVVSGGSVMGRELANRTEEAMARVVGRAREVHTPAESRRCLVVQREMAGSEERVKEVEAICRAGRGAVGEAEEACLEKLMLGLEDEDSVATVSKEDIPQALSFFSNTTECFYVIQSPLFGGGQQLSGCDAKDLELWEKPERSWSQLARGWTGDRSRGSRAVVTLEAISSGVVEIVDSGGVEYVATIMRKEQACLGTPGGGGSESESGGGSMAMDETGSRLDGFQILYNNDRESLNDDDDDAMKADSAKSVDERKQDVVYVEEEAEVEDRAGEEGEEGKGEQLGGARTHRFLQYKSSSSPRESIIQNELGGQEHRARRSLVFLKETDRDSQNSKKRRLSGDKGMEGRRTGSAVLELHSGKLGQDAGFLPKKSGFGGEKAFEGLVLPEELKAKPDRDQRTLDSKKMLVTDAGGPTVRKEVIAAFNSIKELGAWKAEAKGGSKRMSLVIMLSKK